MRQDSCRVHRNDSSVRAGNSYPRRRLQCGIQSPRPTVSTAYFACARHELLGLGRPNYLYYDGHPGIDFKAAMDTQVYAVNNGTIHYPTRIVGLGYPAPAYHVLEIVPDHAPGLPPPYVVYYLHLDTYVGQQKIPVSDPDPLPGCAATVYLPLDEGTHVQAGCLVALSGKAAPPIYHYLPHLHLEVDTVVPSSPSSPVLEPGPPTYALMAS